MTCPRFFGGLIGARTLLWINSQSGRSSELLHLLERIQPTPPACLLTCVIDESSSLASAADIFLPTHAGPEITVTTKTYLNTLEGMNTADFRHGPLELACPGFPALIYAGPTGTKTLNRKLALDILEHGGYAFWIDVKNDPGLPTISILKTNQATRAFVEILPMKMLTLVMAERKNIPAGQFRLIEKITTIE